MNLAQVYSTLLSGNDYGHGHHWRPVWPLIQSRLADGSSWLDVGCGRGGSVLAAREIGAPAEGCDLAPCQPWITRAALPELPYNTGAWDVVGCFDVLEHLPEADAAAACAELRRVARRHLVVSVAECSDPRTIDGVEVELHLTRRPVEWWIGHLGAAHIIPAPDQPSWRTYLDITI
jgi:2-polyprenyl-3-methyl-5-hydroxy-6-metoxy-1,4-benzoquinol methylase